MDALNHFTHGDGFERPAWSFVKDYLNQAGLDVKCFERFNELYRVLVLELADNVFLNLRDKVVKAIANQFGGKPIESLVKFFKRTELGGIRSNIDAVLAELELLHAKHESASFVRALLKSLLDEFALKYTSCLNNY